jgi:hypothetical protein
MPLTKEIFLHLLFESLPPHLKNPEKGAGKVNSEKNIQNAKRGEKLTQDKIKKGQMKQMTKLQTITTTTTTTTSCSSPVHRFSNPGACGQ